MRKKDDGRDRERKGKGKKERRSIWKDYQHGEREIMTGDEEEKERERKGSRDAGREGEHVTGREARDNGSKCEATTTKQ